MIVVGSNNKCLAIKNAAVFNLDLVVFHIVRRLLNSDLSVILWSCDNPSCSAAYRLQTGRVDAGMKRSIFEYILSIRG